ncbi:MAG: hypothetical protein P9E24_09960 [Candidatus Competibacter sp.]|nr:hypothetical protein [Candidatus Competibacter sp.]MDG4585291.1 hypothetical protein [Candidatus Competibacter sp.]
MARRQRDTPPRLKTLVAQESARIMVEEGIQDFRSAKRKAAIRLAVTDKSALPSNAEIEQALLGYQRLFHASRQASHLRGLRETAVEAMRLLARFRPRLVGPVLSGGASPHADIHLHLFADTPTEILLFLMEHRIPFDTTERRLKLSNGDPACLPAFRLDADGRRINLTIFPSLAEREAPRSPVDGRPMRRAGLAEVQALLAEERQTPPAAAPEH